MPNHQADQALIVAERLRESIEQSEIRINKNTSVQVTISIGLSVFHKTMDNLEDLISAADKQLYKAKHSGRNKVCIWTGEPDTHT